MKNRKAVKEPCVTTNNGDTRAKVKIITSKARKRKENIYGYKKTVLSNHAINAPDPGCHPQRKKAAQDSQVTFSR